MKPHVTRQEQQEGGKVTPQCGKQTLVVQGCLGLVDRQGGEGEEVGEAEQMGWGLSPVPQPHIPLEHLQGMVAGEVEHEMNIQSSYKGEVSHWKFPGETFHSCHF